jgi:hypothetical protein
MKLKSIFSFVGSLIFALIIGVTAASFAPVDPLAVAGGVFAVKTVYHIIVTSRGGVQIGEGYMLAGLNKEIWIDAIRDNFYAAQPVLEGVDDWSEWVEFNTINFAAVGADPVVLKNNASWPITAVQRTDTALTIALDTYDTTTTRVRNVEEIEAAYDKVKSATKQHKLKLALDTTNESLVNYAPASNSTATPVIQTTGATRSITVQGGALSTVGNRLTITDISAAQERFDILDYPAQGRRLVLCPAHRRDLMDADAQLFKDFTNLKAGQSLDIFGFEVMPYSTTATYTKSTYVKKAFGAAVDLVNDVPSSQLFCKGEVMRAMGDVELFYKDKEINPEQRAWEIGFQMRYKAVPIRSSGPQAIGAIVTARA